MATYLPAHVWIEVCINAAGAVLRVRSSNESQSRQEAQASFTHEQLRTPDSGVYGDTRTVGLSERSEKALCEAAPDHPLETGADVPGTIWAEVSVSQSGLRVSLFSESPVETRVESEMLISAHTLDEMAETDDQLRRSLKLSDETAHNLVAEAT